MNPQDSQALTNALEASEINRAPHTQEPKDMTNSEILQHLSRKTDAETFRLVEELYLRLQRVQRVNRHLQPETTYHILPENIKTKITRRVPEPILSQIVDKISRHTTVKKIHGFTTENAIYILIYHMCFNNTVREVQDHTGMSYTKVGKLPKKLQAGIRQYCDDHVRVSSHDYRAQLAARTIPENFDDDLKEIRLLLDGTDVKCHTPETKPLAIFDHDSWFSYKFKRSGLRTQVITDLNGDIEWVSSSTPAGKHDFTQMTQHEPEIVMKFGGEVVAADLGYIGTTAVNILHPVKNARSGSDEEEWNGRHSSVRSVIERSFGLMKKRFQMFTVYRGNVADFNLLIKFAFAMTNEIKRLSRENRRYVIPVFEWNQIEEEIQDEHLTTGEDMPLHDTWDSVRRSGRLFMMLQPTDNQLRLSRTGDDTLE